jgi:hypothetical protein
MVCIADKVLNSCPANIASLGLYVEAGRVETATKSITALTKASNAQITATAHGLSADELIWINAAVGGMVEIRQTFAKVVSVVDANNITVDVASTNFTTYTSGGALSRAGRATGAIDIGKAYGWHAGLEPLWRLTTGASSISDWNDFREPCPRFGMGAIVMASDANKKLIADEARNDYLSITSSATLTATRDIQLPHKPKFYDVYNGTTGAQSLRFIGPTGTGITVANAKRARLVSDGTNIERMTADV